MPDWHIRIKRQGRTVWFNLKTANAAEAAPKARDIYVFLTANGLDATLEKFKPQIEKRDNQTLDEFADLYREKVVMVEYPPLRRTRERYISDLFFICAMVGIKLLVQLTVEKIKQFPQEYLKRGREEGRNETSVKITCNSHLRGAASLFSKQMLDAYKADGIELANPFTAQRLRRIEIKPYTPMQPEILDSIWKDAVKLRDGDPEAPAPPKSPKKKRKRRLTKKKCHRWKEPDWRKPHPGAYTILLLELGLGMRREEADKGQWDWFFTSQAGRRFIEVRKTEYFAPKP